MPPKAADGRRKSGSKAGLLVTLTVPSAKLSKLINGDSGDDESPAPKESTESKDSINSPAPSANIATAANSNGDNGSDSNAGTPAAGTPAAEGTPAPSSMAPPVDGRKKGTKRSATTIDGIPKPRGKPGPKKKPRLEDGTIDHSAVSRMQAAKLGPKANQGAINAGLRALDRSGAPCRRWGRGGFKLKSFTGVVWEVPRWTAPTKKNGEEGNDDSTAASADNSSGKENKANGQDGNSASNSNAGGDVEMNSTASVNASSPAPIAISAAS